MSIIHPNTFDKYANKGLSGICNMGNTCYLNTCLQALSHTYELSDFLEKETYLSRLREVPSTLVLLNWNHLRKMLWSSNCIITPNRFVEVIQKVARAKKRELFSGWQQNDISEFLGFLLECFHESIQREVEIVINGKPENDKDEMAIQCFNMIKKMYKKEYSEFIDLFYGISVSTIQSISTNQLCSYTPEPFFILSLPIPVSKQRKQITLYDCIDEFCKPETLENENAWLNEKTNCREAAIKQIKFWSLPTILVIDIKRFHGHLKKNQILVEFPMEGLSFEKYVCGYRASDYVYDLYAVCNHMGSVHGGHYVAHVKNANGSWYLFNDTSVAKIENNSQIITPYAYCLFYRRRKASTNKFTLSSFTLSRQECIFAFSRLVNYVFISICLQSPQIQRSHFFVENHIDHG